MPTDLKQDYLDMKYADYDDESDVPYRRKRERRKTQKSDHKHQYRNCVIVDPKEPKSFYLASYCVSCGKIGDVKSDKHIERKFPHVSYKYWMSYEAGFEDEYEDFVKWCKKSYNVFEVENYDPFKDKYVSI
jgi:hypothetical protein